jgi:hypothetical protein
MAGKGGKPFLTASNQRKVVMMLRWDKSMSDGGSAALWTSVSDHELATHRR